MDGHNWDTFLTYSGEDSPLFPRGATEMWNGIISSSLLLETRVGGGDSEQ